MTTTPYSLVLTVTGKVGSRVLARLTAAGAPRDFAEYVRAAAAAEVWRM
ncbi:hypothetical protein [Rhodococcus sp. NPDC057529]